MRTVKERTRDKILKVAVSQKFTAILDALLDVEPRRTEPAFAELTITTDGYLMGRTQGDCGFNHIIGSRPDLYANCQGLALVAKLTYRERQCLLSEVSALGGSL